jgi:hypothetical protein
MGDTKVGDWTISYNPKPIPDRRFDYDVTHDDYDLDRTELYFCAGSVDEAIISLIQKEIEEREKP